MQLLDELERARAEGHPQAGALPPRQPDHRHPLRQGGAGGDRALLRRAARDGLRPHPRGRGRRAGRGLRRLALHPAGQHELLDAGVRQRRGVHPRGGVPGREPADAAPHLRVGPRAHRPPFAAAHQRHRRRVADRARGAAAPRRTPHPLLVEMAENLDGAVAPTGSRRSSTTRCSPRSGPRSTSRAGSSPCGTRPTPSSSTWRRSTPSQRAIGDDRAAFPEIASHIDADAGGPLLLQLLGLPVAARQLGDRPALPDHADPPAARAADPAGHPAGRDLRLRRRDRPVHRRAEGQAVARAASGARGRALHPRHLPHRRLPGDPGRPAQPLRRHQRGARPAHRAGLRDHRPGPRRHRDRGAQLRPVPRLGPAGHLPAQGERTRRTSAGRRPTASSRISWRGWRATPIWRATFR